MNLIVSPDFQIEEIEEILRKRWGSWEQIWLCHQIFKLHFFILLMVSIFTSFCFFCESLLTEGVLDCVLDPNCVLSSTMVVDYVLNFTFARLPDLWLNGKVKHSLGLVLWHWIIYYSWLGLLYYFGKLFWIARFAGPTSSWQWDLVGDALVCAQFAVFFKHKWFKFMKFLRILGLPGHLVSSRLILQGIGTDDWRDNPCHFCQKVVNTSVDRSAFPSLWSMH
jgi:hypothetical protein